MLRLINADYLPARLAQIEALLASPAGLLETETVGGASSASASASAGGEGGAGPFVCGANISIADLSLYVLLEAGRSFTRSFIHA